jgi:hypothetical protein
MEKLHEEGKAYWTIVKRFNSHRTAALMWKVAYRDMEKLLQQTNSAPVRSRILGWLARNQKYSPGNSGGNGGPPRIA